MQNKTLNELTQEVLQKSENILLSIVDNHHLYGRISCTINYLIDGKTLSRKELLDILVSIVSSCQKFAEDHELVKKQENITQEKYEFNKRVELESCQYLLREFLNLYRESQKPNLQLGGPERLRNKYEILIDRVESLLNNE